MDRKGNSRNLGDPLRSCLNEYVFLDGQTKGETEAAMEVGLTDITLSVGKPRTWGSGEAEGRTDWGSIPYTL